MTARVLILSAFLAYASLAGGCTATTPPANGPQAAQGGKGAPPPQGKGGHELQTDETLNSYLDVHRDEVQKPEEVIKRLGLKEGQTIADIGAGSGYFTWYFSRAVGPTGKVYAVDVDPHAIEFMKTRMSKQPPAFSNIEFLVSDFGDVKLPANSIDWGFLCEAHFFVSADAQSINCIKTLKRALKPGGRIAVIEVKNDPLRGEVSLARLGAAFVQAGMVQDSVIDMYEREYFVTYK